MLPRLWQQGSLLDGYFSADNGTAYPGVSLEEPWPDWSGYRELRLTVRNNEDAPVEVVLRVHDRAHTYAFGDRYNETFSLPPRRLTTLRVPLSRIQHAPAGRLMNLRQIASVILYRNAADRSRDVSLQAVWLER